MEFKESLTNEALSKKFKNQFDMVNYAIKLAENMIKSGREARVKTEFQNSALQIVVEIATGQDRFDEIPERIVLNSTQIIDDYVDIDKKDAHKKPRSSKSKRDE